MIKQVMSKVGNIGEISQVSVLCVIGCDNSHQIVLPKFFFKNAMLLTSPGCCEEIITHF